MEGDGGLEGVTLQDVWEGDDVAIINVVIFRETGCNWMLKVPSDPYSPAYSLLELLLPYALVTMAGPPAAPAPEPRGARRRQEEREHTSPHSSAGCLIWAAWGWKSGHLTNPRRRRMKGMLRLYGFSLFSETLYFTVNENGLEAMR